MVKNVRYNILPCTFAGLLETDMFILIPNKIEFCIESPIPYIFNSYVEGIRYTPNLIQVRRIHFFYRSQTNSFYR